MIEQIHKHIVGELQQNTRTDTIFILTSILLNLITLSVNSGIAEQSKDKNNMLIVMFLFVALIILINLVVIFGLMKGKQTRAKLVKGLMQMYKDKEVDKYYDTDLIQNYNTRYNLFMMVVICTGLIAILVPFILR